MLAAPAPWLILPLFHYSDTDNLTEGQLHDQFGRVIKRVPVGLGQIELRRLVLRTIGGSIATPPPSRSR
jgi:hypothetical protein